KISQVEVYLVTHFDPFDVVWGKVATDGGHVYMYFVTLSFYFGSAFTLGSIWMSILFNRIVLLHVRHDLARLDGLCVVRLTFSGEVEQEFHLIAGDVKQLGRMT